MDAGTRFGKILGGGGGEGGGAKGRGRDEKERGLAVAICLENNVGRTFVFC